MLASGPCKVGPPTRPRCSLPTFPRESLAPSPRCRGPAAGLSRQDSTLAFPSCCFEQVFGCWPQLPCVLRALYSSVVLLPLLASVRWRLSQVHFTHKETEAQGAGTICLELLSQGAGERGAGIQMRGLVPRPEHSPLSSGSGSQEPQGEQEQGWPPPNFPLPRVWAVARAQWGRRARPLPERSHGKLRASGIPQASTPLQRSPKC